MALAGYATILYAKASASSVVSGDEIDGVLSFDFGPTLNLVDITDFKDTGNARAKLATLRDGSISISGQNIMSDAPQGVLRTAATDGSSVWITVEFDPNGASNSKGFAVQCKVAGYKIGSTVEGVQTFSCDLQFTAAPTTV